MRNEIIEFDDDISMEPVRGRIQGHVVVFDPKLYTVDLELRLAKMGEREAEFLDAGNTEGARDYIAGLLAEILRPPDKPDEQQLNAPEWGDVRFITSHLSVGAMGRAIGFFELAGSGRLVRPPAPASGTPLPTTTDEEEPSAPKRSRRGASAAGARS